MPSGFSASSLHLVGLRHLLHGVPRHPVKQLYSEAVHSLWSAMPRGCAVLRYPEVLPYSEDVHLFVVAQFFSVAQFDICLELDAQEITQPLCSKSLVDSLLHWRPAVYERDAVECGTCIRRSRSALLRALQFSGFKPFAITHCNFRCPGSCNIQEAMRHTFS